MSTKEKLLSAHARMVAVLDSKLAEMPEWLAFKDIDDALRDFVENTGAKPKRLPLRKLARPKRQGDSETTYSALAAKALELTGSPVTTNKMVEFVGRHRKVHPDPAKAKINVVS